MHNNIMMGVRHGAAKPMGARRIATGPLPQVPLRTLRGPKTLEDRLLPGLLLFAFVGLMAIQIFHALTR
jgi:hypothetical protein